MIKEIAERYRKGNQRDSDRLFVEDAFKNRNLSALSELVVPYLKYEEKIDIDLVLEFAHSVEDEYILSEIIKILGYRKISHPGYQNLVTSIIERPNHGPFNDVLLSAIYALPNSCKFDSRVAAIMNKYGVSADPTERDAIATICQYYAGVDRNKVLWTEGTGDLVSKLDPLTKAWMQKNDIHISEATTSRN